MKQKEVSLSYGLGLEGPALSAAEKKAIISASESWGGELGSCAKWILDASENPDAARILKAACEQTLVVPDGLGGVRKVSGEPNDCLGPVLLHLHRMLTSEPPKTQFPEGVSVLSATPYHERMGLVELLAHMAQVRLLPDWSYLVLNHPTLSSNVSMLPKVSADAVLRNMWDVGVYSMLSNIAGNHFAKAYEELVGKKLACKPVNLVYSVEETPMGFMGVGEVGGEYALVFNAGSSVFTAKDLIAMANYELPTTFAGILVHNVLGHGGTIPSSAFKNGGVKKTLPKSNVGFILPEVHFTSLSKKTGLSDEDLANFLHRLSHAKLGMEFARVFVHGGEQKSEERRVYACISGFNSRADAVHRSSSIVERVTPGELRRFLYRGYGKDTAEEIRWKLSYSAVDTAILLEHADMASGGSLKADVGVRLRTAGSISGRYMKALGEPYDFDGTVQELRKAYRGIRLIK